MAPKISHRGARANAPLILLLVDFRQYRHSFRSHRRPDAAEVVRSSAAGCSRGSSSQRKLLVFRARIISRACLPSKVRRTEQGVGWCRKGSRQRRCPPPLTRPTLLLPPMQCTDVYSTSTMVKASGDCPSSLSSPLQPPPLEPSAPSPGQVFYNSEDQSDVTFLVGEEEWRFPAHSFILGKMGSTFQALLRNTDPSDVTRVKDAEGEATRPMVIRLPNVQPEVFEQLLRFIYTHQVPLSSVESTLHLLYPAQTYQLPELTSRCLCYISKHLNPNNVLLVLNHLLHPSIIQDQLSPNSTTSSPASCDCHDSDNQQNELVFKCFLLVDRHADIVLQDEAFETLEYEMMVEIVKRDSLEVSSESVVFDAVMRWACRACKRQRKELTPENKCAVLGKALFHIRYLLMTPEEFLRGPVTQGVLSKEDKEAFLARISGDNSTSPSSMPDHWSGWKLAVKRQPRRLLSVTSSVSDRLSRVTDTSTSPSGSVLGGQPVAPPANSNKRNGERKKKSMSKKLLNGVGDLVICVIQLLD